MAVILSATSPTSGDASWGAVPPTDEVLTADVTGPGNSGLIEVHTGDADTNNSGVIDLYSGDGATLSGGVTVRSGAAGNGNSGDILIATGSAGGVGNSGDVRLATGPALGGGGEGRVTITNWNNSSGMRFQVGNQQGINNMWFPNRASFMLAVTNMSGEGAPVAGVEAVFANGSFTIPAFSVGEFTNLRFFGVISVNSISLGAPAAQIRLRIDGLPGGTLLFDTGNFVGATAPVANSVFILQGSCQFRTMGILGHRLMGVMQYSLGLPNAAPIGSVSMDVAGSAAGTYFAPFDTTVQHTIDVTGTTDAAGTELQIRNFYIEMTP